MNTDITSAATAENGRQLLIEAEARRALGWQPAAALPNLACEVIACGLESPALIELAGEPAVSWPDIDQLWQKTLQENGLSHLDDAQAAHCLCLPEAQKLAQAFLAEQVTATAVINGLEELNHRYGHRHFLGDACVLCSLWNEAQRNSDSMELKRLEPQITAVSQSLLELKRFDSQIPTPPSRLFALR